MNIIDLIKDKEKAKSLLEKALEEKNIQLAKILIPIVKDSYLTLKYALLTNSRVCDEWEEIIAYYPWNACTYASQVIGGRFEKGEDSISQLEYWSYNYATKILKNRFPKGEKKIVEGGVYLKNYINFLKSINKLDEFLNDYPHLRKQL
jgi:hypothetical protein